MTYFSEREIGEVPRTKAELTGTAWRGIAALIRACTADGSFGARYPETCPDGAGPCGTDESMFWDALGADIPALSEQPRWMIARDDPPPTLAVLDMIEFCWRAVGKPTRRGYHPFWKHYHLDFDVEAGRAEFRAAVNRIFRRNGLVYELTSHGQIRRLAPPVLREALSASVFGTGDTSLDEMLETARRKFLDPDERVRREALEKVWDAWERIKTLEAGPDKKASAAAILDRTAGSSSSEVRQMLEAEARELSRIGNRFQIRHTETTQERLTSSDQVDYLFHRLFALIRLILRTTGRGG